MKLDALIVDTLLSSVRVFEHHMLQAQLYWLCFVNLNL